MVALPEGETTFLKLSGIGVPPYSARGISQELRPIEQAGQTARTVNGELVDISNTSFRKYRTTITATDQQPPAFDGVWQGQVVTIDSVAELSFDTNSGGAERTMVPGSERIEGDFTFYRPRLTMMITNFRARTDEWGAEIGWTLEAEEV